MGFEEYFDAGGVMIVEWADKFPQLLPAGHLGVFIRIMATEQRCVQWMTSDMSYMRYFLHAS
jgi:tRNA A37 threonylcarbamoyladenosine biosynthesis protein TsaE